MTAVPTVLVVDDDPNIQQMLREILEEEGYSVRVASNGREALDQVGACLPSLILLDLMMPVMDGRQFYREFAERYRSRCGTPVVVLSADRGVREQAGALGVDGYLTKPFNIDDLLREVARFVNGPRE